jgi:hypothetical protein
LQEELVKSLADGRVLRIQNVERKKKLKDALSKAIESQLVVVVLIATIIFAAAFIFPGGYKSDRGATILAKTADFIVFIISDIMSLVLSTLAVFIQFLIWLIKGLEMVDDEEIDDIGTTLSPVSAS